MTYILNIRAVRLLNEKRLIVFLKPKHLYLGLETQSDFRKLRCLPRSPFPSCAVSRSWKSLELFLHVHSCRLFVGYSFMHDTVIRGGRGRIVPWPVPRRARQHALVTHYGRPHSILVIFKELLTFDTTTAIASEKPSPVKAA